MKEECTEIKTNGVSSSSSSTSGGDDALTCSKNGAVYPNHGQHGSASLSCLAQTIQQAPIPMKPQQVNDAKQLELIHRTGYPIVQRNGQRIYGGPPPNWKGPPPCKGTEIFVGKVPRDMSEWELVPIFEKCGTIYELRLMMDFSGSNRGYLFVRFSTQQEAKRACAELNNFEIRPGKYIGVIASVDNRKLWISGIPKNRNHEEIKEEMSKLTDGVTSVYVYQSHLDKTKTRGYAFVEYQTHRAAALARRKLVPGRNFLFDQEIERVDWAEPENEVDDETMSKVRVLFIRNLSGNTKEDEISSIFEQVSDGQVERVKKTKDYAFVHFHTREAAEKAYETTKEHLILDNCLLEVSWSKPIDRHIHSQRKQLTKVLTTGNGCQLIEQAPPIPVVNNPYPQPMQVMAGLTGAGGMIAPRPRGAAGIRGLGAPGTPPPRNLMRKLAAASTNFYPPATALQDFYEMTNFTKSRHFDFQNVAAAAAAAGGHGGGPDGPAGFNLPPGIPHSPPGAASNSVAFFNSNMRMMAPNMLQPPFYYYGAGGGM